jgi:hypothetical protein
MTKIVLTVIGWLIRKLGLLLLLILALLLAPSVKDAWRIIEDFPPATVITNIVKQAKEIAPDKNSNRQEIKEKLAALRNLLDQKKNERVQLEQISCMLPTCTLIKQASIYRADTEIEVITQFRAYGEAVIRGAQNCQEFQLRQPSVNQSRQRVQELNWLQRLFNPQLIDQYNQDEARQTELFNSCQLYRTATLTFQLNEGAIKRGVDARHVDFLAKLNKFKKIKEGIPGQVATVLPSALWFLLGMILAPIGFKTFAYYGVAPLATRLFDVRLHPSMSGELKVLSPNNHLQRIVLKKGEEFLFDPALLRSAPDDAHKSTKYVIDWSMPFTSIAAGMYFLTRIESNREGTVTVYCDNIDGGNSIKMTVLEIPENSSLVLQPRCLAGIVQDTNHPIRITRHWRLGNLSSWLTLQLRYIVFHGPVKLVLKGNNGIEVDPSDAGTSLNQVATLGFSANLGYSVSRCETFYAYYSGKNALFNDRFSSGPGFYLHEVGLGQGSKRSWRLLTHPFEIMWEVLTKAMGI